MVFKKVSFGLGDEAPKALWDESEFNYDTDEEDMHEEMDAETWQDWNSEWLLDNYMNIRDRYESQYLRAPVSFNTYCEIMYANR
jgi:C-terminal processing protease CtpA/Prc